MATEQQIEQLASVIANKLYDQLVIGPAQSVLPEWTNPKYDDPEDETYRKIAVWARSLPKRDQEMLPLVVGRVRSDLLLRISGMLNGTYSVGPTEGMEDVFGLTYDKKEIGQDVGWFLHDLIVDGDY